MQEPKETTYQLTGAQDGFLIPRVNQAADLERQIRDFISYIAKEQGLPNVVGGIDGWSLVRDPRTGKAFLRGTLPSEEDPGRSA